MDKVRCPYCGGVMTLCVDAYSDGTVAGAYYECIDCKAGSPYIEDAGDAEDIKDAAVAAAMQRYTDQTCATCASCKPSDETNRLFCIYHGEYYHEHETYADDYCSNWERRPPDNYIGEQAVEYGAPFDEPMGEERG